MVLLFQCKYRCVKLNMLKLAPKTEQDSMAPDGSIAFNVSIVKKLPPAPRRKDKI